MHSPSPEQPLGENQRSSINPINAPEPNPFKPEEGPDLQDLAFGKAEFYPNQFPELIKAMALEVQLPKGPREPQKEAIGKVLNKLFESNSSDSNHLNYSHELAALAHGFSISPEALFEKAKRELRSFEGDLVFSENGKLAPHTSIGKHFESLYAVAQKCVDIHYLSGRAQLESPDFPLSPSYRKVLEPIIEQGEIVVLLLTREPPESVATEIRTVSDHNFKGLLSLWADPRFVERANISPALKNYLDFATVRLLCTGEAPEIDARVKALNLELEKDGHFEDVHWLRMIKGVSQNEKQESLKDTFKVCIPIVLAVKALENYAPGALHMVGGVLDDIFGAIVPNVSQSLGRNDLPRAERWKQARSVVLGGIASLPLAFGFGWASTHLYHGSSATSMHMLAGACFALACSAGTFGTSVAAFRECYKNIDSLGADPKYRDLVSQVSTAEKLKLAFRNSILDIPFRIGHTLVGVPFQIGFGVAAGGLGFFENGAFVMVEGMAETLFGALAAFSYPAISEKIHKKRLQNLEFTD